MITYDKYIFSANNRKTHKWQHKEDIFLCLKRNGWRIMILDFFLSFSPLNLFGLSEDEEDQIVEQYGLSNRKAVEILE